MWLKSGNIKYNGEEYSSPSGAGKVVTGLKTNGWAFWQIQNHQNQWVILDEMRKGSLKKVTQYKWNDLQKEQKKLSKLKKESKRQSLKVRKIKKKSQGNKSFWGKQASHGQI